jgi:DNA-binding winged helix-turn-helix (wHTH) protein
MNVRQQEAYKALKAALEGARRLKTNILIVTVPGTGMGRFLKEYSQETEGVNLVLKAGEKLGEFNILNFDWAKEGTFLELEQYYRQLESEQKMAVSLNWPGRREKEEVKKSSWFNHIYREFYFGVRNEADTKAMALEIEATLSKSELDRIYRLSGGLAQAVKYLVVNKQFLTKEGIELTKGEGLRKIFEPLLGAIQGINEEELEKLGLTQDGEWQGELLRLMKVEELNREGQAMDIKIEFNLEMVENGEKTGQKVSEAEKRIVEKMVSSQGKISREEISDIKWGEGKYESFSDQAINKAMQRLGDKLHKYRIVTVPRVGYMIEPK